ncbi:MAG: rhodanese-like domain-containing protein [Bacteroidia bacterium]|nr:rhodanese-like domain-containing protein [Bacteroidia bacterium]
MLDVRTTPEIAQGFIEGAIQMDFNDRKFKNNLATLDKDKTYFVYCASGIRSARALAIMKDMGFARVHHLAGGLAAWKDAGLPVTKK